MKQEEPDEFQMPSRNVIIFPTSMKGGNKVVGEPVTPEDSMKITLDRVTQAVKESDALFALVVDKETLNPTLYMGGKADPAYLNMFLDLLKDEIKAVFMSGIAFAESVGEPDGH